MHEKVRKGKLVLKDGSVFEGTLYGGKRNAVGEVVFTTGMSGYQETLTDPSFCGQIVVMTYPLVGNYGCNPLFTQGKKCFFQGFVIGELCDCPSNWRNEQSLEDFLIEQDIPTLAGVDTRAITRKIRNHGVLQGVIVPAEMPEEEVQKLLALPAVHNQVEQVTTPEVYTMGEGKLHVAVMDFGIKRNILKSIEAFGCRLTVFPASATAEEVLACDPDGIFLSAQNHGYAVDEKSLEGKGINISHISMNDGTIEGLEYTKHPTFTVQYHPEACPGPGDHDYLFKHFVDMMEGR